MSLDGMTPWILYHALIFTMLALDLGVFHRKAHVVPVKEALTWSGIWIGLALAFNVGIYFWKGPDAGLQFLTGYLIEKSLSVDNIFVFVLIFSYFKVPPLYQHKVLFWGIIGALIMRAALIAVGAALMHNFHWIIYVFGAFLVFTGIKMAVQKEMAVDPEKNLVVKVFKRLMPVTSGYRHDHFFVRENGRRFATPLLLVLLVVEATDLVFAVDSIPAIFAVTDDAFLVYTSNIFAILGLRSLYFALAGVIDKFHRLKLGLAIVLAFVGTKMMIVDFYKVPVGVALGIVAGILGVSVAASLIWPEKNRALS
jgi:tellurite resistance protein TerC